MPVAKDSSVFRQDDYESARLDLSGGEASFGLLSRLKSQNSALEKLRLALDGDDDASGMELVLAGSKA